jgi:hypothetical protein
MATRHIHRPIAAARRVASSDLAANGLVGAPYRGQPTVASDCGRGGTGILATPGGMEEGLATWRGGQGDDCRGSPALPVGSSTSPRPARGNGRDQACLLFGPPPHRGPGNASRGAPAVVMTVRWWYADESGSEEGRPCRELCCSWGRDITWSREGETYSIQRPVMRELLPTLSDIWWLGFRIYYSASLRAVGWKRPGQACGVAC